MATNKYFMPSLNFLGKGCLTDAIVELANYNPKKVFVSTGKTLAKNGIIDKVETELKKNNVPYIVWSGCVPNPTMGCVDEGLKVLRDNNCDFVLSVGGGSIHDASKLIAGLATNGGSVVSYNFVPPVGIDNLKKDTLPFVACNTTSGTASEMTRFAVITNESIKQKMVIVDKRVTPLFSINDTELHEIMSKELTAWTGMDALTHAVEAMTSVGAYDLTDELGWKAVSLIHKNLRQSVAGDMSAREKMVTAEFMAGMAFNSGGLGYVHATAHQFGGFYNLPHGLCNAVLLPHIMQFNLETVPQKLALVAEAFGLNISGMPEREAAQMAINEVVKLSRDINIPEKLSGLKLEDCTELNENDMSLMADYVLTDICGTLNPRRATKEEIIEIFKKVW
jgi:alcohol dehydrogenase